MSRRNFELVSHLVSALDGFITIDQNNAQEEEHLVHCIARECATIDIAQGV
jgi:hypothetical protein